MTIDALRQKRALDHWARHSGYADFDIYIATGGTVGDALRDLQKRRMTIDLATAALYAWVPPPTKPPPPADDPDLEDYERALSRLEAEQSGEEPPPPEPAPPAQGAEA